MKSKIYPAQFTQQFCCLPISASATVDYNIAKGLAPTSKDQSISVLKPFKGDFRILGSKMYSDDAQAKLSD